MKLFGTMCVNQDNHLEIGGMDVIEVAKKYQTPLYLMDRAHIEAQLHQFKNAFTSTVFETEVVYASKAFLNKSMCRIVRDSGNSMDVVSGGELYTAHQAGFPMTKIYFHGNNKTEDELKLAINLGVGCLVIDSDCEAARLEQLLTSMSKKIDVLLRVNPSIEAHTHAYIQTAHNDSKFGENIFAEDTFALIKRLSNSTQFNFKGFHCHIGSQIFSEDSFVKAAETMLKFMLEVEKLTGYRAEVLNLGGGFGVYYQSGDTPFDLKSCLSHMVKTVEKLVVREKLGIKKLIIEPGRSIVANAGVTVYTVGNIKTTLSGKKYVFVDGGMSDNPRPALYQAGYEATLANRMGESVTERVSVGGKCCESGDVLIENIDMPIVRVGDFLVVGSTGAYNYSMSSNYNRIPRPPVIMLKNGIDELVVKRESYEDLLRNDL